MSPSAHDDGKAAESAGAGLEHVRCCLLDMDGTFYLGEALLPGALEFIEVLRRQGRDFLILDQQLLPLPGRLRRQDHAPGPARRSQPHLHLGRGHGALPPLNHARRTGSPVWTAVAARRVPGAVELEEAQPTHIVLGFDPTLTYASLWRLCDLVRSRLPFIATHADFNCPTPSGYMPDVGAMLALIKASTGRGPDLVVGKPNRM